MTGASPKNSEFLTRKQLIDRRITDAGWHIVLQKDFDSAKPLIAYDRCAIEEYPTENGPADYALCVSGHILGVVEAKKLTLGPQNVLVQAERYSKGISNSPFHFRDFRVPFLYSTNGEVIWHHDIGHKLNRSRATFGFHTEPLPISRRNLYSAFAVPPIDPSVARDSGGTQGTSLSVSNPAMVVVVEVSGLSRQAGQIATGKPLRVDKACLL